MGKQSDSKVVAARRVFSVAQAARSLVLVKRIVADLMDRYSRLLDLQETIEAVEAAENEDRSGEPIRKEIATTADKLHACLRELDDVGAELKDWETGVVDFPCIAGGREVRLCWQYGDSRINYWHDVHDCPAGRKSIETLPVEDTAAVGVS